MADVDEQLATLRGDYEDLRLEHDDYVRENERLRAQVQELRKRYVEAEAQREELERKVDQLITSDRAVRLLLVRAEIDEATGVGSGYITTSQLRVAQLGSPLEED